MKANINSIVEMLDASTAAFAKRLALVFGLKRITYRQLDEFSKKLSSALQRLGVRKDDRVAIWLHNCPEFVYSFFAVLRLGAIVVPVNTMFKREEAKFIVDDCRAKILICSIDKLQDSQNISSRLDSLKSIICLSAPKGDRKVIDFSTLVKESPEFDGIIQSQENDIAEIIYTSGTTGKPKGACLSHKNLISNIRDCSKVIRFTARDCIICFLPLFHSFSSTVCMLLPLYRGAKIVVMRSVKPFKRVIRLIFKHRVTIFIGVPSLYNILGQAKLSHFKLFINFIMNPIRLCICGAATLPLKVCENFEKKFRRPLLQGYGLTEASPVVSLNLSKGNRKLDSVGKPLPSIKVKIIDKDGKDLPSGEIGELLVKGPNVMQGYYNLEAETKKVLQNGWLYTGDLAKVDKGGFIYIVGRLKEMINVRGFNVYPSEIEEVLYKYPQVKEAAVVGIFHRHRGEVPVAFVVADTNFDEKELFNYLRGNLASYKVPLRIFTRENLPKNPAGKILKRQLQEEVGRIFK
ncbi:MAG: long-chain fatty acid--CoA ligase [Omnitrophica bacterium]|nr:long-chain fatty acid--CoA ligase [Candidatus Omnitrophota bacterium]